MPQILGVGSEFKLGKFTVRVLNITRKGLQVQRINHPDKVISHIPFNKLPEHLR